MARKRTNKADKGLPARWRFRYGSYSYRVPAGQEHLWDGKKEFVLGRTLAEAHRTFAERIADVVDADTVGELLDSYTVRVLPEHGFKTRESKTTSIHRLRAVFGEMGLNAIEPHHVYKYVDLIGKKNGPRAARADWEVLRHAYTKAVEWGLVKRHPLMGQVRLKKAPPKERYVEDWELLEALKVAPPMLRAYVQIKLMTSLRRKDMLLLTRDDLKPDAIHVKPSKTADSSRIKLRIEWTDDLRNAVKDALAAHNRIGSLYVFCNSKGQSYIHPEKGTANGFDSLWQRWMKKALAETKLEQSFAEMDLRKKAITDEDNVALSSIRSGHTEQEITKKVYRLKGARVPAASGLKLENE
jgi:integrase